MLMRTPLVSLLPVAVYVVPRDLCSICCAQELCVESRADSARQHHKLFLLDNKQPPMHVCSSARVFVSIVLVDADHACTYT